MSPHDEVEPLLVASGLRKSFGSNEVLQGIDVTLHRGEVVVLIGPSGSSALAIGSAKNPDSRAPPMKTIVTNARIVSESPSVFHDLPTVTLIVAASTSN